MDQAAIDEGMQLIAESKRNTRRINMGWKLNIAFAAYLVVSVIIWVAGFGATAMIVGFALYVVDIGYFFYTSSKADKTNNKLIDYRIKENL